MPYYRADLDVILKERGYHQRSPLVVHDFSPNYFILLRLLAQMNGGLSIEDALEFAHRFSNLRGDFGDRHAIHEDIPSQYFVKEFTDRRIVRVTNLDENLVQRDPEYLPTVLLGVREYLVARYEELQIPQGQQLLEKFGTQFAVQTTSRLTAAQALELGGVPLPPFPGEHNRTLYTFIFDLKKLAKMAADKPARVDQGRAGVQQGFWFFRRINANPFKF